MTTRRPFLHSSLRLLALAGLTVAGSGHARSETTLRFSPVNQYGIAPTASYWTPIIEHVSARSAAKLQLKLGRTSADNTAYVPANEVEFVFSNHLCSPARDKLGWKLFGRRDTPPLHSEIVVLADSPVQTLEQIAGQPVAFPGPEALVAYKFSCAHLLGRNVAVEVGFAGNMDAAFAQLASGKVRAPVDLR